MNPRRIRSFSVLVNSVIITYPNQPSHGLRPVCSGSCWCYAQDGGVEQFYSVEFLVVPDSPYPKHCHHQTTPLLPPPFALEDQLYTHKYELLVFYLIVFLAIIFSTVYICITMHLLIWFCFIASLACDWNTEQLEM